MNYVNCEVVQPHTQNYTLGDLISKNGGEETAFIGTCGNGEYGLYLIIYDEIILMKNPDKAWDGDGCPVKVENFVDINITVANKKGNRI